ncbi:hypothetical protein LguiB_013124 [Lonicera macranthoides]
MLVTVGSLENELGSSVLIRFHVMEIMRQKSAFLRCLRVDVARSENEVQANTDIEFQRNNEISTFVRLGHQLDSTIFSLFLLVLVSSTKQKVFRGSSLCVKVASTKVAHFLVFMLVNSDSGTVEKHLNCQEGERYQVLRFKRMEMSASESGESALSDLLKLNTSGGLSKHRYAFLEALVYEMTLGLSEQRRPIFFGEGKTSTSWVSELAVLTFEGTSGNSIDRFSGRIIKASNTIIWPEANPPPWWLVSQQWLLFWRLMLLMGGMYEKCVIT